jgi:predicted transcriptional regulator of viral defense system
VNSSQLPVASSQKLIDRVREAAQALQIERGMAGTFGVDDLADKLGIQTFADKDQLRRRQVASLVKGGELVRVKPGRYRWRGGLSGPSNQKQVMWRVLRARKLVTAPDLMELAGAGFEYACEFLQRLEKQGAVQQVGKVKAGEYRKYRLVNDPGPELPRDYDKAEYLRRRREQQKAALAKLDEVYAGALDVMQKAAAARLAVSEIGEE